LFETVFVFYLSLKKDDKIQSLKNTQKINKKIAARIGGRPPPWELQTLLFHTRKLAPSPPYRNMLPPEVPSFSRKKGKSYIEVSIIYYG
jgi:hypothetical protein